MTVDISRLNELVERDLVQGVDNDTLQENIPENQGFTRDFTS